MRKEAQEILRQLEEGKKLKEINANQKTKSKVYRAFLYQQVINSLLHDMVKGKYTLSIYELQKMLNRKKPGM